MDPGLEDKVGFIAGASRGIGLAIARAFLREGAKVVITGRNVESLEKASALLAAEAGAQRVLSIRGDMTDPVAKILDRGITDGNPGQHVRQISYC